MRKRTKGHKRKKIWKEDDFLVEEEKWKDNFWKVNPIDLHLDIDTDRDKVIDRKDCRPFDPTKQDVPTRPTIEKPPIVSVSVPSIPSIVDISKPTYSAKPVGLDRPVNLPVKPNPPAPVPTIPRLQQPVTRTIGFPTQQTIAAPQIARMKVEMASVIPASREKPTSPEIQKLIEESRQLHKLPYVQATKTGTTTTETGTKLVLVSKFGEMFWADEKGNILYRAS